MHKKNYQTYQIYFQCVSLTNSIQMQVRDHEMLKISLNDCGHSSKSATATNSLKPTPINVYNLPKLLTNQIYLLFGQHCYNSLLLNI